MTINAPARINGSHKIPFPICFSAFIPHPITAPEKFLAKQGSSPYYPP